MFKLLGHTDLSTTGYRMSNIWWLFDSSQENKQPNIIIIIFTFLL